MVQPHPPHAFSLSIQFTGSPGNCLLFLTVLRPTPVLCLAAQLCPTLCDPLSQRVPHRLLCPGNSPGKTTRVGCHALLQGIFPTGIELGFPALQLDSSPAEPPAKPVARTYLYANVGPLSFF